MPQINRRQFLKCSMGGAAALVMGSAMPWFVRGRACAQVPAVSLNFTITDAIKNMATNVTGNPARCYFWLYKEASLPPEVPGPHIIVNQGDIVPMTIRNALDEPHSFAIPGLGFSTGPIAPGQTITTQFTASTSGTFLYYDDLNEPVNRVMGLHGALVIMPAAPVPGNKFTPYDNPPPSIQALFNDLGSAVWWPGLAWEEGGLPTDPAPIASAFRQYIMVFHQASPALFAEVGDFTPGLDYPANQFVQKFVFDARDPVSGNAVNTPQYFTINGQSGHFSHTSPYINPHQRVGEPALVRILNAGLWHHSMHFHANHFFILAINNGFAPGQPGAGDGAGAVPLAGGGGGGGGCFIGAATNNIAERIGVQDNPIWVDVYTIDPLDTVDELFPYMRPPDVPNTRGIGRADPGLPLLSGVGTTWPPLQEISLPNSLPVQGTLAGNGVTQLGVQLSPLCYPGHDHAEPTQTSQGGNYNMGLIAGMNFTGDRNTLMNFPNQPVVGPPGCTPAGIAKGAFTTAVNPPWFEEPPV
jgi:FtsP/CotA-like multicopper oxidase with cupredoxin domain